MTASARQSKAARAHRIDSAKPLSKSLPRSAVQFSNCSFYVLTERAMGLEPTTSSLGSGTKLTGALSNAPSSGITVDTALRLERLFGDQEDSAARDGMMVDARNPRRVRWTGVVFVLAFGLIACSDHTTDPGPNFHV